MPQAGYHHANHLAQQLRTDIQQRDSDLLSIIQSAVESNAAPPSIAPTNISTVTEIQHHANAMQSDPVQLEILKLLQQMQQTLTTTDASKGNIRRGRRTPKKTLDNASFNHSQTDKYCWTHRGCGHLSSTCCAPAQGHKEDATFENRMGGSNAFCSNNA